MRLDEHRRGGDRPEATTWRQRRLQHLAELVASGHYDIPPIEVAHAILYGRPRWGDNPQVAVHGSSPVAIQVAST